MLNETTAEISNYIPLSRKFFNHFLWEEDRIYSRAEAWIDLMKECRYSVTEQTHIINGRFVKWGRGQWPASIRFLADRWKWSGKRTFSFLSLLEQEKMIKKETQEETGQTIITLCNYEKYNPKFLNGKQQGVQRGNTEETVRKHRGNKTNKDNIGNKVSKREDADASHPHDVEQFKKFEDWISKNTPRVGQMDKPITIDEYFKLKSKLDKTLLTNLLFAMQNKKDLLKKYVSAYLTILRWAKREEDSPTGEKKKGFADELNHARMNENVIENN